MPQPLLQILKTFSNHLFLQMEKKNPSINPADNLTKNFTPLGGTILGNKKFGKFIKMLEPETETGFVFYGGPGAKKAKDFQNTQFLETVEVLAKAFLGPTMKPQDPAGLTWKLGPEALSLSVVLGDLTAESQGSLKKQANGSLSKIYKLYHGFKAHKPGMDKMPELDELSEELIGASGQKEIDDLQY